MAVIAAGHVEQLRAQADRDSLTGLLNRRAFMRELSTEIERSLRYGRRFVLALCDLDEFKRINDTDGHPAGDRALEAVAALLRAHRSAPATSPSASAATSSPCCCPRPTPTRRRRRSGGSWLTLAGDGVLADGLGISFGLALLPGPRQDARGAHPPRRPGALRGQALRRRRCTSRRAPPERSYTRGRGGPRTRRRRHLERRALHALRRGDRRRAPRGAAAPGRRHRHRPDGRRLRVGRGRRAARPRAARRRARVLLPGRRRGPRLLRRRARGRPRASRASPTRACAGPRVRVVPAHGHRALAASASGSTASTCCCCTTPTASATRARRCGRGWRRCATPA